MADEAGVYARALLEALKNPRVYNIAITGPYGSGKSSIIRSFLKKYGDNRTLQISLAAFLPDIGSKSGAITKQEIERSILQQMLYGADANNLPFSRFKRIQTPGIWSSKLISLYIALALIACWHVFMRSELLTSEVFFRLRISNWINLSAITLAATFLWLSVYRLYVVSFGVSLKSVSLKNIEIATAATSQESILNRHLDEIIYFFESTRYNLVVIEDLDRFDDPDIFVTLREINKIVNENSGVTRTIRFLYALRDDMFVNTDRTKFFEFIIPVIPIINSSNSIDMVIAQGKRLSLDDRLDRQFLREVSRYLSDLRLIRNIFNEYAIYVANLETDNENVLNANKLLAILIYKNVFPSDFENLHRGKGILAEILGQQGELICDAERTYKAQIERIEQQIVAAQAQMPRDLDELRKIYAMALIEKAPGDYCSSVGLDRGHAISYTILSASEQFDQIIDAQDVVFKSGQGHQHRVSIAGLQAEVDPNSNFQKRKEYIEHKSSEFQEHASKQVRQLRSQITSLRVAKFNELIRRNLDKVDELFAAFGENAELARYLVLEGYVDDTYYQFTSLFHSGRLSPNDNKFLIQIRGFISPEPGFLIDNPKEVITAMRDEDFGQSYVLNVKIVDCLVGDPEEYKLQTGKLYEFVSSNFVDCEAFFSAYYASGKGVPALLAGLVRAWRGFVASILASTKSYEHVVRLIAHLSAAELQGVHQRYPSISRFVSANLPSILALGVDFEPEQLGVLQIEATDLTALESYPGIAHLLVSEGLYTITIDNVDFIFRFKLGAKDGGGLLRQNYTSIMGTGDAALIDKIDGRFGEYVRNVLLALPDNSEESVSAILAVINHDQVEVEDLKAFLERQTALVPSLDQVPVSLHKAMFELDKIEASWENCSAFLSSESYDAQVLTTYLNSNHRLAALSQMLVPRTDFAVALRQFLIANDALSDEAYRQYVRALPSEFQKFPENMSIAKLQILIDEQKVGFSPDNFTYLGVDRDLQLRFIARNVEAYFSSEPDYTLDDDFREDLLGFDVSDEARLKIVRAMDFTSLASLPSRAAKIGAIVARTGAEISAIDGEAARAIVLSSAPIDVQVSLLNKFQTKMDNEQVKSILVSLPLPYSDIKPGYGTPRLESTDANLDFVNWLEARRIISSWKRGGWFDDDIRINLFRK